MKIVLALAVLAVATGASTLAADAAQAPAPAAQSAPAAQPLFDYREVMIPMRDGTKLQTVIMTPLNQKGPLPILLRRGPYGVPDKAYTAIPPGLEALAADGYIFVIQNIRGRFKSEGKFSLSDDFRLGKDNKTTETRDAWDTIDWLVKQVPNNNGRVGIYGVSYDGYTAGATLLDPHPALKAVSEQASPADEWMNDDDHHYGALRLSYDFEYAVMEEADKNANTHFAFDKWDTYDWYLEAGPLSNLNDKYVHGKIASWNDAVEHPDYDAFQQGSAWAKAIKKTPVPTLNVAGFWDQEDPWGPWQIFQREAASDPKKNNLIVAGPWNHGGWRRKADSLGAVDLGEDTALSYRQNIEAPFFAYWLHGKGEKPGWTATTFQTGSNAWRSYAAWPPAAAKTQSLYLHADGTLSFQPPTEAEGQAYRQYVSDPANPVPYRQRPISPTYPGGDWRYWESADQRFVDHRPDVLTYVSAPLDHDLTITGAVQAELFASTSGTDGDFVVKLIDEYPDDAQKPDWSEEDGAKPGAYGQTLNGYQLPIAMEVRRGRYLDSFEHSAPLTPGKVTRWDVPLRDRDHVFKKGHRIMVQVQSTWFPLIDRNPQTFTPNIYKAKALDYVAATQRVYSAPASASRIILPVVEAAPAGK